MITHSVTTRRGRILQVEEGGVAEGKPVISLHGSPGSRLLYEPHVKDALKRGIRLISYDRPGYGESTPSPGRRIVDAAADVAVIADALGLDKFALWGHSGGGPHSLACAARLKGRLVAAACLSSPAPYNARGLDYYEGMGADNIIEDKAALAGPEELEKFIAPQRKQLLRARPADIFNVLRTLLSPVDRAALSDDVVEFFQQDFREALRNGSAGWRDDDLAFVHPWGFDLSKISIPVLLWHGKHDKFVPFSHGKWLAKHVPGVEAHLSERDGHLTVLEQRIPGVHAWLLKYF